MDKKAPAEQIKSVCEELEHLRDIWVPGRLSEKDIRAGSVALRRLLVNNEIQKVWNTFFPEEKLRLSAPRIVVEDDTKLPLHDIYTCSTATHQGTMIAQLRMYRGKPNMVEGVDGKFRDETNYGVRIEQEDLSLNQFLEQPCMIAKGKLISRNWVIQYVANTLGGAHFGPSKGKPKAFDVAMKKLKNFDIGEMPASVREILATGQLLGDCDATKKLLSQYEEWKKDNPKVRIA